MSDDDDAKGHRWRETSMPQALAVLSKTETTAASSSSLHTTADYQ